MRRCHKRRENGHRPQWSRSGSKKKRSAETEWVGEEKQKRVDSLKSRPHISWIDLEVPFSYSAAAPNTTFFGVEFFSHWRCS